MAQKKSAFIIFVNSYKNEESKKGKPSMSFNELVKKLSPVWNSMSEDEKKYYKNLGDQCNSNQRQNKVKVPEQITETHNNSKEYYLMCSYLKKMFEETILNEAELMETKFILLHVNSHAHRAENYYFPAEIGALEFNLLNGVSRTYNQIIGISKSYPRGFAGGMREYSDLVHKISCWDDHPDDYKTILLDFICFLRNDKKNNVDLLSETLDLPYMYTIESEVAGLDMMKTKSSLERLYNKVLQDYGFEQSKSIFKIGSLERLFFEIKKKMNLHLDTRSLKSETNIFEADIYGHGLGCDYHEKREIAYKCSKSRILQWMSNMCKHISELGHLQLTPGRHTAVLLRDGSRMIVDNKNIPFTTSDLKLNKRIGDGRTLNQNDISDTHSASGSMLTDSFLSSSSTDDEELN